MLEDLKRRHHRTAIDPELDSYGLLLTADNWSLSKRKGSGFIGKGRTPGCSANRSPSTAGDVASKRPVGIWMSENSTICSYRLGKICLSFSEPFNTITESDVYLYLKTNPKATGGKRPSPGARKVMETN